MEETGARGFVGSGKGWLEGRRVGSGAGVALVPTVLVAYEGRAGPTQRKYLASA